MADIQAARAAFSRLGVTDQQTRNYMVEQSGLEGTDSLLRLGESGMKDLIYHTRKTKKPPETNDAGEVLQNRPSRMHLVPFIPGKDLVLACYLVQHKWNTSNEVTWANIDQDSVTH